MKISKEKETTQIYETNSSGGIVSNKLMQTPRMQKNLTQLQAIFGESMQMMKRNKKPLDGSEFVPHKKKKTEKEENNDEIEAEDEQQEFEIEEQQNEVNIQKEEEQEIINEIDMLEEEQQNSIINKDILDERIEQWETRIGDRESKNSNAKVKRNKMFYDLFAKAEEINPDDIANGLFLWTHTAPIVKSEDPLNQGKDFKAPSHEEYFRTGQKNKQADFLKVNNNKLYIADKAIFDAYKPKSGAKFDVKYIGNIALAVFKSGRVQNLGLAGELNSHSKLKIANILSQIPKDEEDAEREDEIAGELNTTAKTIREAITTLGLYKNGKFEYKGGEQAKKEAKKQAKKEAKKQAKKQKESGAKKYIKDDVETEQIKEYVTDTIGDIQSNDNYIEIVLQHCRKVVDSFPNNFSNLKIVKTKVRADSGDENGYYLYPALIIEPNVKVDSKTIKPHIKFIIKDFNSRSNIKIFLRNSFGFLYPTISDLERSIRIWPGQIDPKDFRTKMIATLYFYNEFIKDNSIKTGQSDNIKAINDIKASKEYKDKDVSGGYTVLFKTLDKSLIFVKNIYERENGFKDNEKTKFLHNRVVANIEKANILKEDKKNGFKLFTKIKDEELMVLRDDIFLEVTQVIENLNEYGFELIKQLKTDTTNKEFSEVINASYPKKVGNFNLTHAQITQSGMQAGAIAITMNKQSTFNFGPGYFEFKNAEGLLDKKDGKSSTLHYDPAYNFTAEEDTDKNAYKDFIKNEKAKNYNNVIIDITNVKPSEISSLLTKHSSATSIYLYGSLSKHFQMGMDKFTLGILLQYTKQDVQNLSVVREIYMPNELQNYFIIMQKTHLKLDV